MSVLRSFLFAPGNHPTLLKKVFEAGADAVVLDLEDAVPESEKAQARRDVADCLSSLGASPASGHRPAPRVFVRINSLQSLHWRKDLEAVLGAGLTGIRIPKVEQLQSLCRVHDAVSDRERVLGLVAGAVRVVATIESARGVDQLEHLAGAPRLQGFTFGAADFCADVGAAPSDPTATLFARSRLVLVSRAHRLAPPIASVFSNLDDLDGLRTDTQRQKNLGFFGRSAIHPRQIPVIHEAFAPTAKEVASATKVVEAYSAAEDAGRGVSRIGGEFVDLANVRRARETLELHARFGKDSTHFIEPFIKTADDIGFAELFGGLGKFNAEISDLRREEIEPDECCLNFLIGFERCTRRRFGRLKLNARSAPAHQDS